MNREDMGSAATNPMRASLAKTPGQNIAMSMSSQFRSIQPEDINIRDSNLMGANLQNPTQTPRKQALDQGSGPLT